MRAEHQLAERGGTPATRAARARPGSLSESNGEAHGDLSQVRRIDDPDRHVHDLHSMRKHYWLRLCREVAPSWKGYRR